VTRTSFLGMLTLSTPSLKSPVFPSVFGRVSRFGSSCLASAGLF
jgi:hypothetical protein